MALVCYIWGMKKFEKVFNSQHEAIISISDIDAVNTSNNLGIDLNSYLTFCKSDNSSVVIVNTGKRSGITNQVKLVLNW